MMVALRQLRTYFLNGQFRAANSLLTDRIIREDPSSRQLSLFNVSLVYVLFKLKEFLSSK